MLVEAKPQDPRHERGEKIATSRREPDVQSRNRHEMACPRACVPVPLVGADEMPGAD